MNTPARFIPDITRSILSAVPVDAVRILCVGLEACSLTSDLKKGNAERTITGIAWHHDLDRIDMAHLDHYHSIQPDQTLPPFQANDPFDCMIFADIFERLLDPWQFAERHSALLETDGTWITAITSIRNMDVLQKLIASGSWIDMDQETFDSGHLRFFTTKEFTRLMEQVNIKPVAVHFLGDRLEQAVSSPWAEQGVTYGNITINHVSPEAFAELHAARILFVGRRDHLIQQRCDQLAVARQDTDPIAVDAEAEKSAVLERQLQQVKRWVDSGQIERAIQYMQTLSEMYPDQNVFHEDPGVR